MRIYKDILEELCINSMYLKWKNQNYFCKPLDISGNVWTVAIDADFTVQGKSELIVNTKEERLSFECDLSTVETDRMMITNCIHRCILKSKQEGIKENELINKIREVENEQYKWNKRKEERYEIKFNIDDIQFSSPQQQVIIPNDTLPCFVDNISFGGAKIITYEQRFELDGKIVISYSFTKPPEVIQVPGYIRHIISLPIKENMDRMTALCIEYEHIPLAFQKRMKQFVERLNSKKEEE